MHKIPFSFALLSALAADSGCQPPVVPDPRPAEVEIELPSPRTRDFAKVIRPGDLPASFQWSRIKKVAVSLPSSATSLGRVAEDLAAIKLRDQGFEVIEPAKFSEAMTREYKKLESDLFEQETAKPTKATPAEPQPAEEPPTIVGVGKKLKLDAVISGSVFEGRRQISFPGDVPPRSVERIVVSTLHIEVLDLELAKTVLSITLDYDRGENVAAAVDTMVDTLVRETKRKAVERQLGS